MKRFISKARNTLRNAIIRSFSPYVVCVCFADKQVKHYAWTMEDALEWAACYDACDNVQIHNLYTIGFRDSFVAGRQH